MSAPIVSLKGVSKHYGDGPTRVDAVRDLDLDIHAGTVAGLLGPSGSGKSTVLNLIGAIVDPSKGQISLDGEMVFDGRWLRPDLRRLRLEKIGFIFQFHNLIPFLNVAENIQVVLDLAGWPRPKAQRRVAELLDYLQVADRAHAWPAQLSGGQAQRVAIARALANNPRIILADEPTAALDSERAGRVMDLLRQVAVEQGAAVIVVTHDDKVMARFDVRHALADGRLVGG
ncbi:ABC-type antimicrobial peptide transport system, ATPase component [Magnetospirillum sp. LM-5]|uniref:ABC transporter ATP-binding protein n=1 Tax=Magnetospirillum sp. LM-5 TaxID=2681466 RepID=UPI001381AF74|nr:ABC transporter ATP-binding protein [Magnetospirillum sp. LM-5]CAA7625853.1 ABC-type antimicrobial peptide transport system, ATPase component [Magnetospirillum sp. LM-5]